MGERVTVEGTVENVIFHNEENGYTVLLLTVEGEEEPVTVVGCIPCPRQPAHRRERGAPDAGA